MRLNTEFRSQNPNLVSGFIHVPENADRRQFLDVVGTGIRNAVNARPGQTETTVLLTGFTKFEPDVRDNVTARYLFDDGTSVNPESFGFQPARFEADEPARRNIDRMMRTQFGRPPKASDPEWFTRAAEAGYLEARCA